MWRLLLLPVMAQLAVYSWPMSCSGPKPGAVLQLNWGAATKFSLGRILRTAVRPKPTGLGKSSTGAAKVGGAKSKMTLPKLTAARLPARSSALAAMVRLVSVPAGSSLPVVK